MENSHEKSMSSLRSVHRGLKIILGVQCVAILLFLYYIFLFETTSFHRSFWQTEWFRAVDICILPSLVAVLFWTAVFMGLRFLRFDTICRRMKEENVPRRWPGFFRIFAAFMVVVPAMAFFSPRPMIFGPQQGRFFGLGLFLLPFYCTIPSIFVLWYLKRKTKPD